MEITKTMIGVDFTNNGSTVTILPSDGGWDVCTHDERESFQEHQNAVAWAMAMIGGQLLRCHHNDKWQVARCLVEVETRDEVLGNYTAKFSDGTHVPFHCKDERAAVSVGAAIGQVLMDKSLQRDEVELFRHGFALVRDHNIQGRIMLDMEWLDEQQLAD